MTALPTSEASAFAAATAPHLPRLFRLGLRLTRRPSDSADLVQEALCRAWSNWSRFDNQGSLGAYLSRIVFNTFVSAHRHARVVDAAATRPDLLEHLYDAQRVRESYAPERAWHADDLSDEVLEALEGLPPHYRCVVELVDLRGLPYKEAAEALDVPVGTVMSRLHRARRLMRQGLAEYAASYGYGAAA